MDNLEELERLGIEYDNIETSQWYSVKGARFYFSWHSKEDKIQALEEAKLYSASNDLLESLKSFMNLHSQEMEGMDMPTSEQWYECYIKGEKALGKVK